MNWIDRAWRILISLRFAVVIIVLLAISLAAATIIESMHDTRTAQYFVYRSAWFAVLLSMFGILITAVALSRWPWKKRHIPFLLAHLGIILLLVGSAVTQKYGVDGNLRIAEGETSSGVELDEHILVLGKGDIVNTMPFPWLPRIREKNFRGIDLSQFLGIPGAKVDQYIADSEVITNFKSVLNPEGAKTGLAIQLKILGAPMMAMGQAPEFWLWSGEPGWSTQKLGPARIIVHEESQDFNFNPEPGEATLQIIQNKNGKVKFLATSPRGEKKTGELSKAPSEIDPGWKMPIKFQVLQMEKAAINLTEFRSSKTPSGQMGRPPMPAIRLQLGEQKIWLGLGDRAEYRYPTGEKALIAYYAKMNVLPFGLRLKKFEVLNDPGTTNAAAYRSFVQVVSQVPTGIEQLEAIPAHEISMNEPLKEGKYTFYQASFIPDFPRPTTTVLSVNYDPGRELKYLGSLLIVLGSVLLYWWKTRSSKKKEVENEAV